MATLMDLIMREYGGSKPTPAERPMFPQVYGNLTRQLATEVPLPTGALPGGALANQLATSVPLPGGGLPNGALTRQLATEVPLPQYPVAQQASARPSPWDETGVGAPYNPMAMVGNAQRFPSMAARTAADPLAVAGANAPVVAGLDATNRPAPIAGSSGSQRELGFFEKLFRGPQYQSNNMPVNAQPQGPMPETGATMPSYVNWGDANNAADFFRADALLRQQNPGFFGLLGGGNG